MSNEVNIKNKKASFEYQFLDTYIAGIQLLGTEIKAIRESKASIMEAYCYFVGKDLYVKNMHINEYERGGFTNHTPKRERKLLLNRSELEKLHRKLEKGLTIIPIRLFIAPSGYAKMEIALAQGKKMFDKREDIKKRDDVRSMDRAMKK